MKVRLIGAGAVGAPLALQLRDRCDLALIAEGERLGRLRKGIVINGKTELFEVEGPGEASAADLLIIAVKNFSLEDALPLVDRFVGDSTVILPLLNGIDAEDELCARYGEEKVLSAFMTDLSSSHEGDAVVCFRKGTVFLGERSNVLSQRLSAITRLFDEAGVRWEIPLDMKRRKWWKLMVNSCFSTLSAVLSANYDGISRNGYLKRCARLVAREVVDVANSEGVPLDQDDVESMIERFSLLTGKGKTSMLEDTEQGLETENEWLLGAVIRRAKKHGMKLPYSEFLYLLLEARRKVTIEDRRIDDI